MESVMTKERKVTGEKKMKKLCDNCGQVFSTFLHQMEEQNAKVVCTTCGTEHELPPAKTSRAAKKR